MPDAGFKAPNNNMSIPDLENRTLEFWKKNRIFEKSIEERPDDNLYVFYDGPPFISGLPHYGHLLGSIAKDLIPRYWTMKGKKVERVWGWDAHGLTVENKVQKKLDIKNRRDIETYGLEKFTQECYKYTSEVSEEWRWYVDKIGRWVDMDNAYKTIDQTYMESVMWAFKQMYEKGLIYEGVYTSLYCTTCGTPVSHFEVAMDNTYKDVEDPSIIVRFKVKGELNFAKDLPKKNTFILAWTTTPWTIPSNRALVVDEDSDYVIVEHKDEYYILAEARLESVFKGLEYTVKTKVKGSKLLGVSYEPVYEFYSYKENELQVFAYKGMATMEEGTGVVHSAPGFGEVDTKMGRHYGLTIMLVIDDEGKFLPGNAGENPFAGMYFSKANDSIREDLKNRGFLFKDENIVHRFPYHDRCNTLLIQRAQNSWFVDVQKLKKELLKNNENINWVPEHLKEGRFKIGLEQAPDWCISRARFWATPMPVWESEDGDRIIVESVKELEKLSGQKVKDLHRPYIDNVVINKDGKIYKRVKEVLDSWFEAGSMPYAQIHYPFENREKFEKNFPGDYIVEYVAQTRAWFFFMHVLSTALFATNSFKNVISTGVMAGSDGRKMSKTYGNFTDPKEVLETIGGDALRLYFMSSPLMIGDNANFDLEDLKSKLNKVLNPLWNSVKFFLIYAEANKWDVSKKVDSNNFLDKWIKVRLNQTTQVFTENIENYLIPPAVRSLEEFVDDLSRWYVRRSRERISAGENEALSALYDVLVAFSKISAPVIPFMSETIYQNLVNYAGSSNSEPESVHLCMYPDYDEVTTKDSELLEMMNNTRDVVSLALAVRMAENVKVRQPLSTLYVESINGESEQSLFEDLIKDEVNVKEIKYSLDMKVGELKSVQNTKYKVYLNTHVTEDLELEGLAREMVRSIQDLRKAKGVNVGDLVGVEYPDEEKHKKLFEAYGEHIKKKAGVKNLVAGSELKILK